MNIKPAKANSETEVLLAFQIIQLFLGQIGWFNISFDTYA